VARAPSGPSVKFHATSIHTLNELKFAGNCLKGSRPILNFDKNFDMEPHLRLIKDLLSQAFGTPFMHPRSKPFIDHVLSFYWLDGRIWFRNYQISEEFVKEMEGKNKVEDVLTEVGPRFVLNPVKIFSGSFGGAVLYENPKYVSPNVVRAVRKNSKGARYVNRLAAEQARVVRSEANKVEPDELDFVFKLPQDNASDSEDD
jgi:ribosome biogenesis protein BRX1